VSRFKKTKETQRGQKRRGAEAGRKKGSHTCTYGSGAKEMMMYFIAFFLSKRKKKRAMSRGGGGGVDLYSMKKGFAPTKNGDTRKGYLTLGYFLFLHHCHVLRSVFTKPRHPTPRLPFPYATYPVALQMQMFVSGLRT
jgi:hypothetical protein